MRLILCFLLLLLSGTLQAAKLQSIKLKQHANKASLSFSLDTAVQHRVFTLTNPDRLVVDFENTGLAFNLKQLDTTQNNKLIRLVRSGHPNSKTLRLVFELHDPVRLRANTNAGRNKEVFSLDIAAYERQRHSGLQAVEVNPKPLAIKSATPLVKKKMRSLIVVLDPGHGGKDPGAIGPHRSREKHLTLAIAKKLKERIDSQKGMKAILTRQSDYYVGLRQRLKIARRYNADIFISIHADAFIKEDLKGASVFALSQRGATSEAARWLAEKENYSELGGVNLKGLDDQSGLVRTVLIDLSQTATISASVHMGDAVLHNLANLTQLHSRKVEQARFMVLKSPDIPSILIETGFISNPSEEKDLSDPAYQQRLANSIFTGIKKYFSDYPPHDSYIAAASYKTYYVQRGDTLSDIAFQNKVSMLALQALNHMENRDVKIGQALLLPQSATS